MTDFPGGAFLSFSFELQAKAQGDFRMKITYFEVVASSSPDCSERFNPSRVVPKAICWDVRMCMVLAQAGAGGPEMARAFGPGAYGLRQTCSCTSTYIQYADLHRHSKLNRKAWTAVSTAAAAVVQRPVKAQGPASTLMVSVASILGAMHMSTSRLVWCVPILSTNIVWQPLRLKLYAWSVPTAGNGKVSMYTGD